MEATAGDAAQPDRAPDDLSLEFKDQTRKAKPRKGRGRKTAEKAGGGEGMDPDVAVSAVAIAEPTLPIIRADRAPIEQSLLNELERLRELERQPVMEAQAFAPPSGASEAAAAARKKKIGLLIVALVGAAILLGLLLWILPLNRGEESTRFLTGAPTYFPSQAPTQLVWQISSELDPPERSGKIAREGLFGREVATSDDGTVVAVTYGSYQWFATGRRGLSSLRDGDRSLAVAFAYNHLAVYTCNDTCALLGVTGGPRDPSDGQTTFAPWKISLSGDGRRMAIAADDALHFMSLEDFPSMTPVQRTGDLVALNREGNFGAVLSTAGELILRSFPSSPDGPMFSWFLPNNEIPKAVVMSSDGTRVAVASDLNATWPCQISSRFYNGTRVRVFGQVDRLSSLWAQMGGDIESGEVYESIPSEHSIGFAANGTVIAIGSAYVESPPFFCTTGSGFGYGKVQVWQWEDASWNPVGPTLRSATLGDLFGVSVSLSASGQVLAVGTPSDDSKGQDNGQVSLYRFDGGNWTLLGDSKFGVGTSDFGASLVLSGDGTRLVVGAPNDPTNGENTGRVLVFDLTGVKNP